MSGYPNSEDEFDLMYGDEMEMLKELEENEELINPGPPSRRSLNFNRDPGPSTTQDMENSFDTDFQKLEDSFNEKKRNVDELYSDTDQCQVYVSTKRQKKDRLKNEDSDLIELINKMREQSCQTLNPNLSKTRDVNFNRNYIKNNVSRNVPKYPFIALTTHDNERIYIRMHNSEYEKEEIDRIKIEGSYTDLLGSHSKLWQEAQEIINKGLETTEPSHEIRDSSETNKLWVDLYRPTKYTELLSDESLNRALLKWLKLWDKVVFRRVKKPPKKQKIQDPNPPVWMRDLDTTLDEHDRPQYKVALLCGPPGLGKTTLAHVEAQKCGYNVVEVNASDDRSTEKFKQALENSTQMRSVLDKDRKPNCLIFDEIDGAPASSINFLINFIQGNTKTKKGKKQKFILKRPIICICNDVYTPALRPLRQISFILTFSPTNLFELGKRLTLIARQQNINLDAGVCYNLAQRNNFDIRSCLTALSFFKDKNVLVTSEELDKANIGAKDEQKDLFNIWSDLFQSKKDISLAERMSGILNAVIAYGDYERLTEGVFENYPLVKQSSSSLEHICKGLEWFCYTDCLSKKIHESQNYYLNAFIPYGFVVWHYAFAGSIKKNTIQYPKTGYEMNTKRSSVNSTVSFILDHITPSLRCFTSRLSLVLDTLPMLLDILVPSLRTVNISLYAPEEKERISRAVDIMIDYCLTYVQEKNEHEYQYKMEPDLEEIAQYPGMKNQRRILSYTSRQMLAREIEVEKMRREQVLYKQENEERVETGSKEAVPNHLRKLEAKNIEPQEVIVKDFFGQVISKPVPTAVELSDQSNLPLTSDLWYDFKEGLSHAVRRPIFIEELLENDN